MPNPIFQRLTRLQLLTEEEKMIIRIMVYNKRDGNKGKENKR